MPGILVRKNNVEHEAGTIRFKTSSPDITKYIKIIWKEKQNQKMWKFKWMHSLTFYPKPNI